MPLPAKVSESFKRLNPAYYATNTQPKGAGTIAILEHNSSPGPLAEARAKETYSGTFFVRITSFRHRLLDEDNLCEKYHVDLCRYAGILPSDSPAQTRIVTTQEKISSKEDEYTLIEISKEDE